jgi:hypothetical protein
MYENWLKIYENWLEIYENNFKFMKINNKLLQLKTTWEEDILESVDSKHIWISVWIASLEL